MGKHSDFRISSIQVVNARRILQLKRKTEKYFKVFIWLGGRSHKITNVCIHTKPCHGSLSWVINIIIKIIIYLFIFVVAVVVSPA